MEGPHDVLLCKLTFSGFKSNYIYIYICIIGWYISQWQSELNIICAVLRLDTWT